MDRVAASRARLAGQARADPVGVRGDRARARAARARRDPLSRRDRSRRRARRVLDAHGVDARTYRLHVVPNDRVWLRDSAPTGVIDDDGTVELVNWGSTRWAKYDNYAQDAEVGARDRATSPDCRASSRCGPTTASGSCSRAAASRANGAGRDARHRGVAAHRRAGAQSRADARRLRAGVPRVPRRYARRSGSAKAASATTRTATSTTSRGSSPRHDRPRVRGGPGRREPRALGRQPAPPRARRRETTARSRS